MTIDHAEVCCMSVTPFQADERVDEGALRAHLQFLGAAGVSVSPASTGTGEGHQLTPKEVDRICELAVQELKGKAPVYGAMEFGGTERSPSSG